jgi:predicted GNAT family N-acyltransferase
MNIREFTKPLTSKKLNESLAKTFGQKINLTTFTVEQLQDVRNKLRSKVFTMEQELPYNELHGNTDYQKNKLFIDTIHAEISEREDMSATAIAESIVTEGEEDKAELIMAARDMVDRVTSWMEDTAEMQAESMLELADAIRDEMGSEASETFTATVKPSLESLYTALESTRGSLTQGVGQLTGEDMGPAPDMGDDMDAGGDLPPVGDDDMEPTTDMEADDEFAASAAAGGGEEEAGRAKRESRQFSKKKIAETSRKLATTLSKKK